MAELRVIQPKAPETQDAVVDLLRSVLAEAEQGEVENILIVRQKPSGDFATVCSGNYSVLELVGALETAKHDIMAAGASV